MEMVAYESRSSVNDTQLITRVVAGDAAAERELYETYVDRIYRLAFRLAGEDELARDFTQATFIRAFEKIGSFRGESSLSTWPWPPCTAWCAGGLTDRSWKRARDCRGRCSGRFATSRRAGRDSGPAARAHRGCRCVPALPWSTSWAACLARSESWPRCANANTPGADSS